MFGEQTIGAASPPYLPGYLAFPPAKHTGAVSGESRIFDDGNLKFRLEHLQAEREELERAKAAQAEADAAWLQMEEARYARRARLKEETLKAQIEWERMGGKVRDMDPADAELRHQLDDDARLTDEERKLKKAWEEYDRAWGRLMISILPAKTFTFRKLRFTFAEVPWPVLSSTLQDDMTKSPDAVCLNDITAPTIAKFLLHPLREPQKSRREKLRETTLRYHPDKFEGRILPRVIPEDRVRVKEAAGVVMQCLNELMSVEI